MVRSIRRICCTRGRVLWGLLKTCDILIFLLVLYEAHEMHTVILKYKHVRSMCNKKFNF